MPSSVRQNTTYKKPPKPLQRRGCYLTECQKGTKMRTDEGVCPYFAALSLIKGTPFSNQGGRFLAMKRASLHIEETPSLFADGTIHAPLHSERGRG